MLRIHSKTLDNLLKIETDEELWSVEVNNVHLWSIIRTQVLKEVLHRELDLKSRNAPSRKQNRFVLAHFSRHGQFLWDFLTPTAKPHDALFIKVSTTRIDHITSQTSLDRVYDPYFEKFDNPLILEDYSLSFDFLPDHAYRIYPLETLDLINAILKRFYRLPASYDQTCVDFAHDIANLFQLSDEIPRFIKKLQGLIRIYHIQKQLFESYIVPHLMNRICFMHASSYLADWGLRTKALHDLDFKVYEIQHGLIYPNHIAYNYPLSCFDPDHPSQPYLPDAFISYGEYWHNRIQLPTEKIALGYPYLNKIAAQAHTIDVVDNQCLLISQLVEDDGTNPIANIAEALAENYPDLPIVFKLHPREHHLRERYQYLTKYRNIRLADGSADVYHLIAQSELIVGDMSTVLVEALAFDDKRIFFSGDDGYISSAVGYRYTDLDDLISAIAKPDAGLPTIREKDIWQKDWSARCDSFLSNLQ